MANPSPSTTLHHHHASYLGHLTGLTLHASSTDTELCHFFGGIPYALPPVGEFRWKLPRALPPGYRYGTKANPGVFTGGAAQCPQPGWLGPPKKELFDENCLQLNVWVPVGTPPKDGWPVLFFIHGGWLQHGSPNGINAAAQLGETDLQCIIVCPAYRLNVFGFLACIELQAESQAMPSPGGVGTPAVGNYGFWDQRMALQWTHKHIHNFGGDEGNITVAGYSAGAYSTFHQLSHDLYYTPPATRLIRRAIMHSNGPGVQPKSLREAQLQFTSLLSALSIPASLTPAAKLAQLRATPAPSLLAAAASIPAHEFRAVADAAFIPSDLFASIDSGAFARRLREGRGGGTQLMLGECRDEHHVYGSWRAPAEADGLAGLERRLMADYPAAAVYAALERVYARGRRLPQRWKPGMPEIESWTQAFGHVYADLQVHALERGFVDRLVRGGAGELVHRYRIEWRAGCADAAFPAEWGVTHGTDMAVWFWGAGWGAGLAAEEKRQVEEFRGPFVDFVMGRRVEWGATTAEREVRRLKPDGQTDVWLDDDWERGVGVYNVIRDAQKSAEQIEKARL